MAKFRVHWLKGNPKDVEGDDVIDALIIRAGYPLSAFREVDWIEEFEKEK